MSKSGHQEVVMLYGAEEDIQDEMLFRDFAALLAGEIILDAHAASLVRAAYCVVGNGFNLRGVVFFLFNVTENGQIDPQFNLPLHYLAEQAGAGLDLGQGPIRQASRGQCAVPWHSVNLWEPQDVRVIEQLQSRIFRNRLKLKTVVEADDDLFFSKPELQALDPDSADTVLDLGPLSHDKKTATSTRGVSADELAQQSCDLTTRLTEVFGPSGKLNLQDLIRLHSEQLNTEKAGHRQKIEQQQLAYLDQIRVTREEIHSLKVALRQEQSRNRRLQQMLRGGP